MQHSTLIFRKVDKEAKPDAESSDSQPGELDIEDEAYKDTLQKAESGLPQQWNFEILPTPDPPPEQWLKML